MTPVLKQEGMHMLNRKYRHITADLRRDLFVRAAFSVWSQPGGRVDIALCGRNRMHFVRRHITMRNAMHNGEVRADVSKKTITTPI